MNDYARQHTLPLLIDDAEKRLGQYLAVDGCKKKDPYAQAQIQKIKNWSEELFLLSFYNAEDSHEKN